MTVFAAVLVGSALPLGLAGFTVWIYSMLAKSARAHHASHGVGVVAFAMSAVGALLLGVYAWAAVAVALAVLFARWWWLTRPACERVS